MAIPAFVNVGTVKTVSFTTALTGTLPGSRVNGNLLIAYCQINLTNPKTITTATAGWTIFATVTTNNGCSYCFAYAYVTGSEVAPVFTWTGNTDAGSFIMQYSGTHASRPIGYFSKACNYPGTAGTAIHHTGMKTGQANSLGVLVYGGTGAVAGVSPSGYTARNGPGSNSTFGFGLWDVDMTTQGAMPDNTVTLGGNADWFSFMFELTSGPGANKPALCIDGESLAQIAFSGVSSKTITGVFTNAPGAILLVTVYNEKNASPQIVTSSVSGGSGLTWNQGIVKQLSASTSKGDLQVWWARADTAQNNQTLTVTLSDVTDNSWIHVFAVDGLNIGSLLSATPVYATNDGSGGSTTIQVTGITSDAAESFELWVYGSWVNTNVTRPTAMDNLGTLQNNGGTLDAYGAIGFQIWNAPFGSTTRTAGTTTTGTKWQLFDVIGLAELRGKNQIPFMGG